MEVSMNYYFPACCLLPLVIYLIFIFVLKFDPKNRIDASGSKYQALKIILTLFMSLLSVFIVFSSYNQSLVNSNFPLMGIGLLFSVLGNYFKTIKSNYFIGIRTPWTLENETVWKKTHQMAGKYWFTGGLIIFIAGLFTDFQALFVIFMFITIVIAAIPHCLFF